jgi:hypothetical protein
MFIKMLSRCDQDVYMSVQVLAIKTDGGPDRNVTFVNVQLAYFALAQELGLVMLIAMRTTPGASYLNPVERCMSCINLCIQGIATARDFCSEELEKSLKGAPGNAIRDVLDKANVNCNDPPAHEQWKKAMQQPIDVLTHAIEVQGNNTCLQGDARCC